MSRLLRLGALLCALALPALAQEWIEVRSPHFVVITDTGLSSGRAVAQRFEQMRQVFGSILQRPDVRAGVPLHIIAFKTAREAQLALPLHPGMSATPPALFVAASDADYAVLDLSAPDPYAGIARDYARSVIVSNTPPLPLWYDTGLAAYFSTVNIGRKDADLGRRPAFAEAALAGHKLIPASQFLALTRATLASVKDASLYDAQSWLLMSWILAQHKLPAVNDYARLVTMERLAPPDAFLRAFGIDAKDLNAQLLHYFDSKPVTTSYTLPDELNDISTYAYADSKVPLLSAQVAVADFHVHSRPYLDQGVGELENMLTQDQNNAAAHRSLGFAYLEKNDLEKAGAHLSKSNELEPNDARTHYCAAFLVYRLGQVTAGGVASYEMKSHLQKALDLEPNYADAWFMMGHAWEADEKFPYAIDSVLKAIRLAPRNDAYRLALARIYGEAKRWDDATALLNYLKDSPDPEVARQVPELTARLETMRTAPKRTGRFDERPRPSTYDAPKWRTKPEAQKAGTTPSTAKPTVAANADASDSDDDEKRDQPPKPDARPILFLKGRLVSAACHPTGAATLTISAGKRTVQLSTPDYKKLVVIGADSFSCSLKDVNVAANYRESSATTGDLVSLELQ